MWSSLVRNSASNINHMPWSIAVVSDVAETRPWLERLIRPCHDQLNGPQQLGSCYLDVLQPLQRPRLRLQAFCREDSCWSSCWFGCLSKRQVSMASFIGISDLTHSTLQMCKGSAGRLLVCRPPGAVGAWNSRFLVSRGTWEVKQRQNQSLSDNSVDT